MKPLDRLKAEQSKAKAEMKIQEERISRKLHVLEENFGKITLNSVLPLEPGQIDKAARFLNPVNSLIDKIIPDSIPEDKREKYKGMVKTVEMAAAGLVFRYLRKWMGGK
ncbi:MAG: hypothetical protein U0Y08_02880 [Bacteroidia bacterium]